MLNILSVSSAVGVFVSAINLMCAYTPTTVISLLNLNANM